MKAVLNSTGNHIHYNTLSIAVILNSTCSYRVIGIADRLLWEWMHALVVYYIISLSHSGDRAYPMKHIGLHFNNLKN